MVRREGSPLIEAAELFRCAHLVARHDIRRLFVGFCRAAAGLPGPITVTAAPFDMRFEGEHGFLLTVTPLRDIFLVSLGSGRTTDVRVSSRETWLAALDLAVHRRLEAEASAARGETTGS